MTKIEGLISQAKAAAHSPHANTLSAWSLRQLSPPVFVDVEKTRLARLSHVLIQVSFIVILFLCLVTFFDTDSPLSPILFQVCLWLELLLVLVFVLVRYGQVRFANRILNFSVLLIFLYEAIYLDNGIHSIGYGLLFLSVIHAGILLGRRAAFINAGLAIVIGILLQYGHTIGRLPFLTCFPVTTFGWLPIVVA